MKRRTLVLVLGGTLTSVCGLRAQQRAMPVIGTMSATFVKSTATVQMPFVLTTSMRPVPVTRAGNGALRLMRMAAIR